MPQQHPTMQQKRPTQADRTPVCSGAMAGESGLGAWDDTDAHEREVLRQAGIALNSRVVTLWEISPEAEAVPLATGQAHPPPRDIPPNLHLTLRHRGPPTIH